jgi:hypothetical protein
MPAKFSRLDTSRQFSPMANPSTAELYIQITPLRTSDYKRITHSKSQAVLRVKVSACARLSAISSYIHGLGGSDSTNCTVALHVPYRDAVLQLPLTMTISEFRFIANQTGEGDLRYSFVDPPAGAETNRLAAVSKSMLRFHPPPSPKRPSKPLDRPPPMPLVKIPEPLPQPIAFPKPQIFPSPQLNPADSFGGRCLSGFPPWSNSFGIPTMDVMPPRFGGYEPSNGDDMGSFMTQLELELNRP